MLGGAGGGGTEFVPGVTLLRGFKYLPGLSAATAAEDVRRRMICV